MRSKMISRFFLLSFFLAATPRAQVVDSLEYKPEKPQGLEIVSKRTWNSKTYLNADNTATVEISSGYLHYRDHAGHFQDIDHRLVLASTRTHFEVTKGLYNARFALDLTAAPYPVAFELQDGTRFQAKLTSLAYFSRSSKQVVMLQTLQKTAGVVNGNKIRYPQAFNGVDVEFEYIDTQLKQNVYLSQTARNNLPAPQTFGLNPNNTDLVLVFQFDLQDSLEAFVNNTKVSSRGMGNKLLLTYEGEDGVELRNNIGKQKFTLPPDLAFAAGDSAKRKPSRQLMLRRFYNSGNNNLMLTGVPLNWLNSQPQGTVVLDPTVSLSPPTDDTWIENGLDSNFGSYTQIRIGRMAANPYKRSLVRFDVSAVPQNATLQSASLQLYYYLNNGTAVSRSIQCHQVLQQWKQLEATWVKRLTAINWGTAGVGLDGVDAKATPEDTQTWFTEVNTWKSYNLTALTQQWVNGSQPNYGVIFWATNEATYNDKDEKWVYSSEYTGDVTKRPKLVVTYTVNPLVDIAYDALSRPTSITYANGIVETNQYDDNRGWLKKREYKKGTTDIFYFKSDLGTDFDKAGNLKHVAYKHENDSEKTMDYAYNRLYRLTQFTPSGGAAKSYGYDPNGNLNSFEGLTFTYPNKNNQLKEVKNGSTVLTTYLYDHAGRVNQINATGVSHNFRNNMTAHGTNTYAYDAFSQRIKRTESVTNKYYMTSGPQVLAEYTNNSGPDAEYIYALGRMITKFDPAKGYSWFYVDHLGSTRRVDGPDSQTDLRRDYQPYGLPSSIAGTEPAYQFTQKELDNVSELSYFGARYYERDIGRWLTPDPIMSDFSPYSYVRNRPLIYKDLFGLEDTPAEDPIDRFKRELQEEWDAVWSPSRGGGGGGGWFTWGGSARSYVLNYRSSSGGRYVYDPNGKTFIRYSRICVGGDCSPWEPFYATAGAWVWAGDPYDPATREATRFVYGAYGTATGALGGPFPFGLASDIRQGTLVALKSSGKLVRNVGINPKDISRGFTAQYYKTFNTLGWAGTIIGAVTAYGDYTNAQSDYERAMVVGLYAGSTIGGIAGGALGTALLPGWGTLGLGVGGSLFGGWVGESAVNWWYRK